MEGDPPNAEHVNAIRATGTQFLTKTRHHRALEPAHGEAGVSGFGVPPSTFYFRIKQLGAVAQPTCDSRGLSDSRCKRNGSRGSDSVGT